MQPTFSAIPTSITFETRKERAYALRRVTPADLDLLFVFLRSLSERTRLLRYMVPRPFLTEMAWAEAARMAAGSAGDHITLIVTEARGGEEAVVAVAELAREGDAGEIALVVRDDAQRQGIGGLLLRQLVQIAQEIGLTQLHSDMLAENQAMRRLLRALGLPYTATIQSGEMRAIVRVPQTEEWLSDIMHSHPGRIEQRDLAHAPQTLKLPRTLASNEVLREWV